MMNKNRLHEAALDFEVDIVALGPFRADDITRGVCRHLRNRRYSPLTEFRLISNRRVDVAAMDRKGRFIVVEVKSSVRDFQADNKWPDYLPHCDRFYFAVAGGFPAEILPDDVGILVADAYDAAILRDAPEVKMNAARRRTQIVRFAQTAADRLHRVNDPQL